MCFFVHRKIFVGGLNRETTDGTLYNLQKSVLLFLHICIANLTTKCLHNEIVRKRITKEWMNMRFMNSMPLFESESWPVV